MSAWPKAGLVDTMVQVSRAGRGGAASSVPERLRKS
jgi:hypothetical protein